MNTILWTQLLQPWSNEILNSTLAQKPEPDITPEMIRSRWLGYAGATEQQITDAELRLKTTFPPSYRTFLLTTNGWSVLTHFTGLLWDTEHIEWLRKSDPAFIRIWSQDARRIPDKEYLVYGDTQDAGVLRGRYFRTGLEISNPGYLDGEFYMLNPQIVTPEGEWEAWFFASWLPGARRYRSFWDLMQAQYQMFRKLEHG